MVTPADERPVRSVYDLIERNLGIRVDYRFGDATDSDQADKIIARNDPGRVALIIVNMSANTVYIRPLEAATTAAAIILAASGGSAAMNWRDDLILQALEWHSIASADNSAILVIEAIISG
tara:strand:- start:1782 stop:2144 length:363 start_codon:yes stop_codon:yes gene_type:complete